MDDLILKPLHPGEVLREEFMGPHGLSAGSMAMACGVSRDELEGVLRETAGVTFEFADKIAKHFGTTREFWLNLQNAHNSAG